MNQIQYAIKSSFVGQNYDCEGGVDSHTVEVVESLIPRDVWSKINSAESHEDIVLAHDLITDFINDNKALITRALRLPAV